jgi:adenine/guanine phosphoribosyltransferase-like PRPP-binding protein
LPQLFCRNSAGLKNLAADIFWDTQKPTTHSAQWAIVLDDYSRRLARAWSKEFAQVITINYRGFIHARAVCIITLDTSL